MNPELLKENRVHGNIMYPVSVYHMSCAPGATILDMHWHEELELLLVTSGQAVFQVGAVRYEMHEGEALFIGSGELHAGYPLEEAGCGYSALVFSADFVAGAMFDAVQEKFLQPLLHKQVIPPVHLRGSTAWEQEALSHLKQAIRTNTELPPTNELSTKGRICLLIAHLFEHAVPNAKAGPKASGWQTEQIKAVLHYIHSHYQEPIRLRSLCELAKMSEGHFCRFFRKMVQRSPLDYIKRYRTRQAASLLEQTDRKIAEIALDTGFENISYFTRVFKEHMGVTPSDYRKITLRE